MTTVDTPMARTVCDEEVVIIPGDVALLGRLRMPEHPIGIVIFAHGCGSDRHSLRNRFVADALAGHRLATLTIDLLTPSEVIEGGKAFDVELLGRRLIAAHRWLRAVPSLREFPVGYFGAGSEAPVALWAAAEPRSRVRAVVVRGGRPDLAGGRLVNVLAPTLYLVGGQDCRVRVENRRAAESMRCEHRITELASAAPLLESQLSRRVAYLAAVWFTENLTSKPLTSAASEPERRAG
ncbi:dienelactone hydrolase family protein [Nocardia anaemiae]|uniref:dienelactone hydrolase family protein n=1 Tax=Nocardia anaemiae TaxID=263910 RepID=UPI000AE20596|nr:hypothetical protein [Nocardia anaemiae]